MDERALTEERLVEVEISKIRVNPHQPRRHFGKEELEELAESIKALGIIQPPVVRWIEESGAYELISGERRFRAAFLAGLKKIPVVVRGGDAYFSAEAALVENIQRVDLNPMEIAKALVDMRRFGVTQEALADRLGKKRSTVANYFRLFDLPKTVQQELEKNSINMGHAKAILSLKGEEQQKLLCDLIIKEGLTVREAETRAQNMSERYTLEATSRPVKVQDPDLGEVESSLRDQLGTKVQLQGTFDTGRLIIDYYSKEDLERLVKLLKRDEE